MKTVRVINILKGTNGFTEIKEKYLYSSFRVKSSDFRFNTGGKAI